MEAGASLYWSGSCDHDTDGAFTPEESRDFVPIISHLHLVSFTSESRQTTSHACNSFSSGRCCKDWPGVKLKRKKSTNFRHWKMATWCMLNVWFPQSFNKFARLYLLEQGLVPFEIHPSNLLSVDAILFLSWLMGSDFYSHTPVYSLSHCYN